MRPARRQVAGPVADAAGVEGEEIRPIRRDVERGRREGAEIGLADWLPGGEGPALDHARRKLGVQAALTIAPIGGGFQDLERVAGREADGRGRTLQQGLVRDADHPVGARRPYSRSNATEPPSIRRAHHMPATLRTKGRRTIARVLAVVLVASSHAMAATQSGGGDDLRQIDAQIAELNRAGRFAEAVPLAVPAMLEIGRESIPGDASEALLREAVEELIAEAMGHHAAVEG